MKKRLDKRIDEGLLWLFIHVKKMEKDMIAKRVYVGVCAGSHSLGSPQKRWIDTMKKCLRKRGLDVMQERRMVQDRCEWLGFVRGNAWCVAWGMNPLTMTGCESCELPQLYEAFGWKSVNSRAYNVGYKEEIL